MAITPIILAAGASRRLGRPKQMVVYQNESLLRRTIKLCHKSGFLSPVVVVGCEGEKVAAHCAGLSCYLEQNHKWPLGMSSSLQAGLKRAKKEGFGVLEGVIFLVCDQPFLDEKVLSKLKAKALSNLEETIFCQYGLDSETFGPPAYIPCRHFPKIERLKGDEGAKKVVGSLAFSKVLFPSGGMDIDTAADLARLEGL